MPPLPDVLAAMIFWAKADPELAAIYGGRVASRLPANAEFPFLRVFDFSGQPPIGEEAPISIPVLQWDSFAGKVFDDSTAPDYALASRGARTLANRLRGFDGHNPTEFPGFERRIEWAPGEIVLIRGVAITAGPVRQPDPEGLARYRVDSAVQAVAG